MPRMRREITPEEAIRIVEARREYQREYQRRMRDEVRRVYLQATQGARPPSTAPTSPPLDWARAPRRKP